MDKRTLGIGPWVTRASRAPPGPGIHSNRIDPNFIDSDE